MPTPTATNELVFSHQRVKLELRRRIRRDWPVGTRLPPILKLAKELQAGQTSTHRAVRELAAEGVLLSRPGAGTFVAGAAGAGSPGPAAFAGRRVQLLHFAPQPEEFALRLADVFTKALADSGLSITRGTCIQRELQQSFSPEADALVLINPNDQPDIVCAPGQLLAVINTALESPVGVPVRFDVVSVDQEQGGMLAGRYVRDAGAKLACFVGRVLPERGGCYDATSEARLRGFERGWGRPLLPEHRLTCRWYTPIQGAQAVESYLKLNPRPDTVFAVSDEVGIGFILGAASHGLRPGEHFNLVGFDGQALGRRVEHGPLTTVDVPVDQMGRRAAELLLDRFRDPDQPVRRLFLGCKLFEGATVRRNACASST